MLLRSFPWIATLLVGAANFFAFRIADRHAFVGETSVVSIGILAAAWVPLTIAAAVLLLREEMLRDQLTFVAGDATKAIAAAAIGLGALYGIAMLGIKVAPARAMVDLHGVFAVAGSVDRAPRAAAVIVFAAAEELVFRAAVTRALEDRFGSTRAVWIATALFVMALLPSLHPSLIAAAISVGAVTSFLVARERRVLPAMLAHALLMWVAVDMMAISIWQRLGA